MYPKKHGFTLVELIIVMVIVGLFGSMTVPTFQGYLNRSRIDQAGEIISARLAEASNGARSARNVRIVQGWSESGLIQIWSCPQGIDPLTDEISCDPTECENVDTERMEAEAPGVTLLGDFDVRYVPPHGDVFIAPAGTMPSCEVFFEAEDEAIIKLENEGGEESLLVHGLTGLVEPVLDEDENETPAEQ